VLKELTLLVHPARQEPLGRVLLEAAATGLPIVATDVGGTQEIFPLGTNSARLIEPDDAVSLADAVIELLSDERERAKMGAAARDRAEAAFGLERATRGLIEQYRQVLAIG
jgi:glycosyltransferase involved in cell wall biosynthesis